MRKTGLILLVFALFAISSIAISNEINYQGRLTDDTGEAADGFYQLTFAIYNSASASLWTSYELTVEVTDGLFNHVLGSSNPIPDSVFEEDELYLGIQVGTDPEITPRTKLTSAPYAAVAGRVDSDDMESGEGYLYLKNINGDSIFTFTSDVEGGSFKMSTPIFGGKGHIPVVELLSNGAGGGISLYTAEPLDRKILEFTSDSATGGRINMYMAEPLDKKLMEFGEYAPGEGSFNIYAAEPLDEGIVFSLNSNPTSGISMRMFQPQPEPPGREALSMGVNPVGNVTFKMFQPQPEPPGMVGIEMTMNTAEKGNGGGRLSVFDADSIETAVIGGQLKVYDRRDGTRPSGSMTVESEMVEMSLTASQSPMGGPRPVIFLYADSTQGRVGIGSDTSGEALFVVGNILATGTITAMTTTKCKTNIGEINNALDKVSRLRGVSYDWRQDEYPEYRFSDKRQIGFLAEEVNEIIPEVVLDDENGPLAVDYGRLTALLVEAIKEQQETINQLQKRIEAVER